MEKHFLEDHVEGKPGFHPEVFYNAFGDCLEYTTVSEAPVADRIDEVITIYRSTQDNRPIGFQIKGVRSILRHLDADQIHVVSGTQGDRVVFVRVDVKLPVLAAMMRAAQHNPTWNRNIGSYADLFSLLPAKREVEFPQTVLAGPSEP